jgi:hypothetical protein
MRGFLVIHPWHYGLDRVLLAKAIAGYAYDSERRSELASRALG